MSENGFHPKAGRELSPETNEVVITRREAGFDVSIAERAEQPLIFLNIAPSSLLILWIRDKTDSSEQDANTRHLALSLASLPRPVDPEKAEVTYGDGRVWLHLSYVDNGLSPSEPDMSAPGGLDGRFK